VHVDPEPNVIVVPIPIVYLRQVEGGDAKLISAEPEAVWAATSEAPDDVVEPEAALKLSMFLEMIEVEASIAASPVVANPFTVFMDRGTSGCTVAICRAEEPGLHRDYGTPADHGAGHKPTPDTLTAALRPLRRVRRHVPRAVAPEL